MPTDPCPPHDGTPPDARGYYGARCGHDPCTCPLEERVLRLEEECERLRRELDVARENLTGSQRAFAQALGIVTGERDQALARVAALESYEASLHKHASRAVGAVVRWLRAMAEEGDDPWMSYCADAIERGEHVERCEANPEPVKETR